jgi:hypothetical protein
MTVLIEADLPATWKGLEGGVARILAECGYDVAIGKNVQLAGRGDTNIDVWADDHSQPPNVIAVECKRWAHRISKDMVRGFRARVVESGANLGLIVSAAGFQAGAVEAAAFSNVVLLTWPEFQRMFIKRWFVRCMVNRLADETDALSEYTEPINSRIFRKADALGPDRQERFKELRQRHIPLAAISLGLRARVMDDLLEEGDDVRSLPLRPNRLDPFGLLVPDEVLDAPALRPLMDALIAHSQSATEEFDEVFGERA